MREAHLVARQARLVVGQPLLERGDALGLAGVGVPGHHSATGTGWSTRAASSTSRLA